MDRTDLRRLLTATEREIAQGEILIQNQRWRIETLKRAGQDTADADEALHSLVRNQATQEQHRAKLKINRGMRGTGGNRELLWDTLNPRPQSF